MKKLKKFFPFLDGCIYVCIFSFVFNLPIFLQNFDYKNYCVILFISIFFALISSVIFLILLFNEHSNKKLASFLIKSLCSRMLFVIVWIIIKIYFPISSLPIQNTNIAYGIIAVLNLNCFLIVSCILRIFVLILLVIRNRRRQGDGSLVLSPNNNH